MTKRKKRGSREQVQDSGREVEERGDEERARTREEEQDSLLC